MDAAPPTQCSAPVRAARGDLSGLIAPGSIAFVGASERPNAPATRGLRHCQRLGFAGPMFAVNPKHSTLFGIPCVASVSDLPISVDLAVIALPAESTLPAVDACQRKGVRAAVICSSGWGEGDESGKARQKDLKALLSKSPMRVLGPNCIGVGSASVPFCAAFNSSFEHVAFRHRRPVGVVCQSGAMIGGLLLNGEDAGAGVEAFMHVGNAIDITIEEAARALLHQPGIQALAMLVEGLSDGRAFVALAREAAALGKRLAVFKCGTSDVGRQAVQSHTGALAGSDELFDAVCRDEGVVRVAEPEDLLQVARVLSERRPARGRRVLVYTLSGGGASILADELSAQLLAMPGLAQATVQACDALRDPFIRATNPFDVGGSVFSNPETAGNALRIAAADPNIDAVAWIGVGAPRDERSNQLLGEALDILVACEKPAVVLPLSGTPVEAGFSRAHELGIPVARSAHGAALLLCHALHSVPSGETADTPPCPGAEAVATEMVDEVRAREMLSGAGVPMIPSRHASDVAALRTLAAGASYPAVLKGRVSGIGHKTEAGLVALRLPDADAVLAAALAMSKRHPDAITGFALEPHLEGGIETVIGVRIDPQFGAMLMFGTGGTAVELFGDVAFTQCPCTTERAMQLVGRTRAATLLRGFRGAEPGDTAALVRALVALSEYAAAHAGHLLEVEINPFVVLPRGRGALGVDVLVIHRPTEAR